MATHPRPRPPIEPSRRARRPRRSPELAVCPLEGRELLSSGFAVPGLAGSGWPRSSFADAAETRLVTRPVKDVVARPAGVGPTRVIAAGPPLPPPAITPLSGIAAVPAPGGLFVRDAGLLARLSRIFGGPGGGGATGATAPKPAAEVAGPQPLPRPDLTGASTAGLDSTAWPSGPLDGAPPPGPGAWLSAGGYSPWRQAGSSWDPGWPRTPHPADDPVAMARAMVDGKVLLALVDPARSRIILQYGSAQAVVFRDHTDGLDKPCGVALEDLSGTGRIDLIVANSGGNDVMIYPGLGGGRFGPELNGGRGIAVGDDPVGITVADVNGDGLRDIVVADKGSNDLTLLFGQGQGAGWTMAPGPRLPVGPAPVSAVVQDVYKDGHPDILVSNSGANDVYLLKGLGGGVFDVTAPVVFPVGADPVQILVGHFDRYPGIDLLTVNKGSNDLTLISNIASPDRVTQTYKTNGVAPDSAMAVDMNGNGLLNVVVANSGSGSFSLFRGGATGLELASTFYDPNLPSPTALAPVVIGGGQVEFFAGSSGQDSADLLAISIGAAGGTVMTPNFPGLDSPSPLDTGLGETAGGQVVAQLIPLGGSSLDVIALLVTATRGDRPTQPDLDDSPGESTLLDLATAPVGQSPVSPGTIDAGGGPEDGVAMPASAPSTGPAARSPTSWTRFVLGVDEALDRDRLGPADPSASPVDPEDAEDRAPGGWLAAAGPAGGGPRGGIVDEAIGDLSRFDGPAGCPDAPPWAERPESPGDRAEPPAPVVKDPAEVAATASAATLFALRMVIKLVPRRRPRRGSALRPGPGGPDLGP